MRQGLLDRSCDVSKLVVDMRWRSGCRDHANRTRAILFLNQRGTSDDLIHMTSL